MSRGERINTSKVNINEIEEEYKPDNSIWSIETKDMNKLKNIIFNELSEADKRIILLYADMGSQREVGKTLGVSLATANLTIRRIQNIIKNKLKDNDRINTDCDY